MGIRTTIVLDEDVLERVRERAQAEHVPFKTKLNDLVRDGLAKADTKLPGKFVIPTFNMGPMKVPHPIKISDIDSMEDEERFGIRT